MPSQIKVDEIKNVAGQYKIKTNVLEGQTTAGLITVQSEGTATTNLQQGLIKAWCTVDENSTVTVRDGFNNSSVTDNSTGNTSFTMTNAFNNTDFSLMALASQEGGATSYDFCYEVTLSRTSSVVRVESRNYGNGSVFDDEYKMIQICGDLA